MYQKLRETVGKARAKFQQAKAQGKVTPELQRLANEARAAFRARDPIKFEKAIDEILEKLG